jgi:hypothetical protein
MKMVSHVQVQCWIWYHSNTQQQLDIALLSNVVIVLIHYNKITSDLLGEFLSFLEVPYLCQCFTIRDKLKTCAGDMWLLASCDLNKRRARGIREKNVHD